MLNEIGLHVCMVCGETDLAPDQMEPLSVGDPSNTCKACWTKWESDRAAKMPMWREKWGKDRVAEAIEGERREREGRKDRPLEPNEAVFEWQNSLGFS